MQADLIVMGAWGHSRIAELVLGGATRHLFQLGDLPLFVGALTGAIFSSLRRSELSFSL